MEVASHFEGRVRIRDAALTKEPLLSQAREALLALPGVSSVEANPRVGSVLVLYAAAVTALEKLLRTLAEALGVPEQERPKSPAAEPQGATGRVPLLSRIPSLPKIPFAMPSVLKNRIINNIGMLASLGLSLAAVLIHLKKLHVLAGIVFVGLFGIHLFERRRLVFA
jgi:hypothetical protein